MSEELRYKHSEAMANLKRLESLGCVVIHQVNAHTMSKHPFLRNKLFDRIVFNFPHATRLRKESDPLQIRDHQVLVKGFLRSARELMGRGGGGEVHVTLKTCYPYSDWKIHLLAPDNGLQLVEAPSFSRLDYPGYFNRRGHRPDLGGTFRVGSSCTFVFRTIQWPDDKVDVSNASRNTLNQDGDMRITPNPPTQSVLTKYKRHRCDRKVQKHSKIVKDLEKQLTKQRVRLEESRTLLTHSRVKHRSAMTQGWANKVEASKTKKEKDLKHVKASQVEKKLSIDPKKLTRKWISTVRGEIHAKEFKGDQERQANEVETSKTKKEKDLKEVKDSQERKKPLSDPKKLTHKWVSKVRGEIHLKEGKGDQEGWVNEIEASKTKKNDLMYVKVGHVGKKLSVDPKKLTRKWISTVRGEIHPKEFKEDQERRANEVKASTTKKQKDLKQVKDGQKRKKSLIDPKKLTHKWVSKVRREVHLKEGKGDQEGWVDEIEASKTKKNDLMYVKVGHVGKKSSVDPEKLTRK